MPVIYEGAPSTFSRLSTPSSSSSSSSSKSLHPPLRRPCQFRTFSLLSPLSLAGLCGCIALFALLGLYLRRRSRPAASISTSPLPLHIRTLVLDQKLHQHPQSPYHYVTEKRASVVSLAASYYDTEDDLGMEKSPIDTTKTNNTGAKTTTYQEPATMQTQSEQEEWAPQWPDNAKGITTANSASQISSIDSPPRRRSYTKMKSQSQNASSGNSNGNGQNGDDMEVEVQIQEEIVVAEGWRRHTRVYGGGVCLACAESERRNLGGGMFKGVDRGSA